MRSFALLVALLLSGPPGVARAEEIRCDPGIIICFRHRVPVEEIRRPGFLARAEVVATEVRRVDDHLEVWQTLRLSPPRRGVVEGTWFARQVKPVTPYPCLQDAPLAAAPGAKGWAVWDVHGSGLLLDERRHLVAARGTHLHLASVGRGDRSWSTLPATRRGGHLRGSDTPPVLDEPPVLDPAGWQDAREVHLVDGEHAVTLLAPARPDGRHDLLALVAGVLSAVPPARATELTVEAPEGRPPEDWVESSIVWTGGADGVYVEAGTVVRRRDGAVVALATKPHALPVLARTTGRGGGVAWVIYPTLDGGAVGWVAEDSTEVRPKR